MKKPLLVGLAVAQLALGSIASAESSQHAYLQINGASGFHVSTTPKVGGEAGVYVAPQLSVFINGEQFQDFSPEHLLQPNPLLTAVMRSSGPSLRMSIHAAGLAASGGVRYQIGSAGWPIQPYVRVAAGMVRLQQQVRFTAGGRDVTGPVILTDLFDRDPSGPVSLPLATLGGGVRIPIKRLHVDLGYGMSRLFSGGESPVQVTHVSAGVGVRF